MEDDMHSITPTTFDTELIEQLGTEAFQLQNPTPFFSLIERQLPIVGSMATGGELLCAKADATSNDWIEMVRSAIVNCVEPRSHQDLSVVVVGDNMINYAYALRYSCFVDYLWDFFSIPQDTYVLLEANKLCFQYTFEDELFIYLLN
ncbi:hypothetical protein [Hymenobacter daeguensis]